MRLFIYLLGLLAATATCHPPNPRGDKRGDGGEVGNKKPSRDGVRAAFKRVTESATLNVKSVKQRVATPLSQVASWFKHRDQPRYGAFLRKKLSEHRTQQEQAGVPRPEPPSLALRKAWRREYGQAYADYWQPRLEAALRAQPPRDRARLEGAYSRGDAAGAHHLVSSENSRSRSRRRTSSSVTGRRRSRFLPKQSGGNAPDSSLGDTKLVLGGNDGDGDEYVGGGGGGRRLVDHFSPAQLRALLPTVLREKIAASSSSSLSSSGLTPSFFGSGSFPHGSPLSSSSTPQLKIFRHP